MHVCSNNIDYLYGYDSDPDMLDDTEYTPASIEEVAEHLTQNLRGLTHLFIHESQGGRGHEECVNLTYITNGDRYNVLLPLSVIYDRDEGMSLLSEWLSKNLTSARVPKLVHFAYTSDCPDEIHYSFLPHQRPRNLRRLALSHLRGVNTLFLAGIYHLELDIPLYEETDPLDIPASVERLSVDDVDGNYPHALNCEVVCKWQEESN